MDIEYKTPILPPYVAPQNSARRGSAASINRVASRQYEKTLNLAGFGETIPVLYGEDRIGGVFIAGPETVNGIYYAAIAWTHANENAIGGVQKVILNGSDVIHSSVGIRHYDGTQTLPDSWLEGAFAGFDDAFKGVAYSVFRITSSYPDGIPKIEAIVRGIRIKDPRDDVVKWTRNPTLCAYDFVTNKKYGAGMSFRGALECANFNDEMDGGVTRCQSNIYIDESHALDDLLDSFAAYAECFWTFEGSGVYFVPDWIVDESKIKQIKASEIERNSLRFGGLNSANSPTEVVINYVNPSILFSQPWPQGSVSALTASALIGESEIATSTISMPWIHRENEAQRKAILRLNRLQSPATIALQIHDGGIKYQKGDVLLLPNLLGLGEEATIRVLSNEMIAAGQYQITGEIYGVQFYDTDYTPPATGGVIPAGGIIPYFGTGVPEGFTDWTEANGRLIRASDAVGTEEPDPIVLSGKTTLAGRHQFSDGGGSAKVVYSVQYTGYSDGNGEAGEHDHDYEIKAEFNKLPMHESLKLVRSNGDSQTPIMGGFFSNLRRPNFSATFQKRTAGDGLMISSGGTGIVTGSGVKEKVQFKINNFTIGRGVNSWGHGYTGYLDSPAQSITWDRAFSDHLEYHYHQPSHRGFANFQLDKIIGLNVFTASLSTYLPKRCIIGYDGDPAALPPEWKVCDGQNGTADFRGYFIKMNSGNPSKYTYNLGINYSFTMSWAGEHSHELSEWGDTASGYVGGHNSEQGGHTHSINGNFNSPIVPAYDLIFIEYLG